jgi:hypothetical protein
MTMAKRAREQAVREKRARKLEKKLAARNEQPVEYAEDGTPIEPAEGGAADPAATDDEPAAESAEVE